MFSDNERQGLEEHLSTSLGLGPVNIIGVDRIAMGQSRAMYRVDIEHGVDGPKLTKRVVVRVEQWGLLGTCLLYTSPSPRDRQKSRMPSSA